MARPALPQAGYRAGDTLLGVDDVPSLRVIYWAAPSSSGDPGEADPGSYEDPGEAEQLGWIDPGELIYDSNTDRRQGGMARPSLRASMVKADPRELAPFRALINRSETERFPGVAEAGAR